MTVVLATLSKSLFALLLLITTFKILPLSAVLLDCSVLRKRGQILVERL